MSFNIRYDNPSDNENKWDLRKEEVVDLIENYHPDFVGIQEGLHDQVTFLREHTTHYNYIGVGRDDGKEKGEYTAIYYDTSKFQLVKTTTFWLSESPDTVSVGWNASMERICTYGQFKEKKSNYILNIFNAHFDHIGAKAREMSAKLILSKIDEYNLNESNIIVMGDFNANPDSRTMLTLKEVLDDGLSNAKHNFKNPHGTWNGFDTLSMLDKRIDYILTSNVHIVSYEHIDDTRQNMLWPSDHLPVFVKILCE